ncbi:dipeptidase [Sandarakinorhabdus sp. DWP1-3-1]|uniref:dipeptidase n=1 Tax=Sandarakinorhabdus sp. DWP1-3-1 TaxID=2804627 RepID=UPI003CF1F78F
MRKFLIGLLVIFAVAVAGFFGLAPMLAEKSMNKVAGGRWPVSAEAAALHKRLTIVDLHSDTLMWQRHLDALATRGHVDLPRLEAGNVALQVFSSVTKTPKGQNYESNSDRTDNITLLAVAQAQPVRTWTSLLERSLWHAEKLRAAATRAEGRLLIVRGPDDVDRLLAARAAGQLVTGALLSTEGTQNLEGKVANIDVLYRAGFRMMGLAHFFDNQIAGSMHGEGKYGLTPLGRQAVAAMEQKGIIIDLAHSSHRAFADVMAMATRPVVVSHGGVKATCDTNRNLTDAELRQLAANGGMIGIGYWDAAVCAATPDATARAIVHAVRVAGVDHVGLGSDFDGATTTGFDTAHVAAITDALLRAGMAEADIAKVMGGNALRLIAAGLRPLAPKPLPA